MASLSPEDVAEKLRERPEEYTLLDVREPDEREVAAIEPSLHVPMNDVPRRLAEIPKDTKLIIYCHHGSRSMMVAGYLVGAGYASVANLDGGIDAW
ncbi:MAG TPA: rhodanese-like domain-containing protein, partial [Thermoplasmata archaeon]|nr:rhodanese-like domain-containing protein [Thermoplasmata archaeon]